MSNPHSSKSTSGPVDNVSTHIAFLLDREMRRDILNGRKSRAKACEDRIHAMGLKTVAEEEEEAEKTRLDEMEREAMAAAAANNSAGGDEDTY